MRELRQRSLQWLSLLLLLLLLCCSAAQPVSADQQHLRRLFDSLDKDHDGELRRQELREYVGELGAPEYSHSTKLDQAVEKAIGSLDSPDVGLGVSWTELEQHLHTLLQVRWCGLAVAAAVVWVCTQLLRCCCIMVCATGLSVAPAHVA